MAKNAKELSQVKARQTKLGKKNSDELIQIVLKKDKIERNLNNQIKSLKGEVNSLSTRVANFDSDMAGTLQSLESYKDKVNTLVEQNSTIKLGSKDNYDLYIKEREKTRELTMQVKFWRTATFTSIAIATIAVIVIIL